MLGFHLESWCVGDLEAVGADIDQIDEGAVSLLEERVPNQAADVPVMSDARPLADMVRGPDTARALLHDVYAVESVAHALSFRARLQAGQSCVTQDGVWVGCNWMRVARNAVDGHGILSREQEIKQLDESMSELQADLEAAEQSRVSAADELASEEQAAGRLRTEFADQNRAFAERRAELGARQSEIEQARERASVIRDEVAQLREQLQAEQRQITQSRDRLAQARSEANRFQGEKEALTARRQAQTEKLGIAREQWQSVRDDIYEVGVRAESMRTKLMSLRTAVARDQRHAGELELRTKELRAQLDATEAPLTEAAKDLESKLAARRNVETELEQARKGVEETEEGLRELEQQRSAIEKRVETERTKLDELRMRAQETRVRRDTVEEQLGATGNNTAELLQALPDDASESVWEELVEKMERRITRLGPINLAAIDEYDQQAERKQYLDAQHDDLVEALDTLQQAIQKIDRETRTRFKETYERVNSGLAETFPRLFGGGAAFLEMTGDDLLNAGITMVARPPGKRNTSIHLLSGGEKALSAIALVFSIFELNPAPFCLLDEVDAPLDDANVGRFCELVSSMTDRVQFIVVTHNKATMETTHQLLGVTMSEPGISRLVAVDVDEAAELAAV